MFEANTDIEYIEKILAELPQSSQPALEKTLARKMAREIIRLARQKAPIKTGALRRSLKYRTSPKKYQGPYRRRGEYLYGQIAGARHLHWLDKGTGPRETKKGFGRGKVRPTYFLNRAFSEVNLDQVVQREFGPAVAKEVKRLKRKYERAQKRNG